MSDAVLAYLVPLTWNIITNWVIALKIYLKKNMFLGICRSMFSDNLTGFPLPSCVFPLVQYVLLTWPTAQVESFLWCEQSLFQYWVILAGHSQIREKCKKPALGTNTYILIEWISQCFYINIYIFSSEDIDLHLCLSWPMLDLHWSSFPPCSNFKRISSCSDYNFASFPSGLPAKFFPLPGKLINNTIYVIKSCLCFFCSWVPYQFWQYIIAGDIWTQQSHHPPPFHNKCIF